jgi:hypothetical protein
MEHLLTLVGAGWTVEQIQTGFPFIEAGDLQQAPDPSGVRSVTSTSAMVR